MAMTCNRDDCNGAVALKDDNGVVDPAEGDRVEFYECEYGHEFTKVLRA